MRTTHTGDGSRRRFGVGFPFLDRAHVIATVNAVGVPFTWISDSEIETALPVPAGDVLVIQRVTPDTIGFADIKDTTSLTAEQLNRLRLQLLFLIQERSAELGNVGGAINAAVNEINQIADARQDIEAALATLTQNLATVDDLLARIEPLENIAQQTRDQLLAEIDSRSAAYQDIVDRLGAVESLQSGFGALVAQETIARSAATQELEGMLAAEADAREALADAVAAADSALAARLDSLETTSTQNGVKTTSLILDVAQSLSDRIRSIGRLLRQIRSEYQQGDMSTLAAVENESITRAAADSALAATVDSVRAALESADAALDSRISNETIARTNETGALAAQLGQLSASSIQWGTFTPYRTDRFDSSTDGWTARSGGTLTPSGSGAVTLTASTAASGMQKSLSGSARIDGGRHHIVRFRMRIIGTPWADQDVPFYFGTEAGPANETRRKNFNIASTNEWQVIEIDMRGVADWETSPVNLVRIDPVRAVGRSIELDWFAVGRYEPGLGEADAAALNATITAVDQARSEGDKALAERINTLAAGYQRADADLFATIQNVSQASANGDAALASSISTLQSQVNSQGTSLATVQTQASTTASKVSGLEAQYTLKVQATRPDGKVVLGGIGVAAVSNGTIQQSEIVLTADRLVFVAPGDPNGPLVPILAAGQVNGSNTLVIPSARFGDQTVGARVLVDGEIEARHVKVNGLTSDRIDTRGLTIKDDAGNVIFGAGTGLDASLIRGDSFVETWESGLLSEWENISGSGELSFVTDTAADGPGGARALRVGNNSGNDQAWLISKRLVPFNPNALYRIRARVRRVAGAGRVYVGVAGVAADGTTYVNTAGSNATSSQHYFAAEGDEPSGSGWVEYVGYFRGTSASGNGGRRNNPATPGTVHTNVRYVKPLVIVNYSGQSGETRIGTVSLDIMSEAAFGVNISGQITPSNVSTFIADAAIGNAQIGGDIQSDNFVSGSTGWRIRKADGSAEFNNVTARGTITANAVVANSITTAGLQANAVTKSAATFVAADQVYNFASTSETDRTFSALSLTVTTDGGLVLLFPAVAARGTASSYGGTDGGSTTTCYMSIIITRNGTPLLTSPVESGTRSDAGVYTTTVTVSPMALNLVDAPPAGTHTYEIRVRMRVVRSGGSSDSPAPSVTARFRSLIALETKR